MVTQSESTESIPVNAKVHVSNLNIEGEKIEIGILIQLAVPLPSETSKKD
jgi:sRNA-binding carbon storage regulator CsrA